jgi:predicted transcriptional regulator
MESGNQSGKSGERIELYDLVQQIKDEIDEKDEEKEEEKREKRALDETSEAIVSGEHRRKKPSHGFGKRLGLDGTVISEPSSGALSSTGSSKNNGSPATLDGILMQFLQAKMQQQETSQTMQQEESQKTIVKISEEEEIEACMRYYMRSIHMSELEFMTNANITSANDCELIHAASLSVLLSAYCTPKRQFDPAMFKAEMKELGFSPIACHKIFSIYETANEI